MLEPISAVIEREAATHFADISEGTSLRLYHITYIHITTTETSSLVIVTNVIILPNVLLTPGGAVK